MICKVRPTTTKIPTKSHNKVSLNYFREVQTTVGCRAGLLEMLGDNIACKQNVRDLFVMLAYVLYEHECLHYDTTTAICQGTYLDSQLGTWSMCFNAWLGMHTNIHKHIWDLCMVDVGSIFASLLQSVEAEGLQMCRVCNVYPVPHSCNHWLYCHEGEN